VPLRYQGESGAINEAIADIFGELADRYIKGDDEEPGEDTQWLIGEGVQWANGARFLRSLADPATPSNSARLPGQALSCVGIQPDRMTHPCWDTDPNNQDNGGVHTNSGVAAKIAYLMAMGGQFNGQTVRPAAADTRPGGASDQVTARIWFEVLKGKRLSNTALLRQGNDGYVVTHFELGRALMAACRALVGTPGITKTTCDSTVAPAITATEVVARQFTASVPKTAIKNRSTVVSATVRTQAVVPRGLEGQKVTLQKFDPKKKKWVVLSSSRTNSAGKVSFGVKFAGTSQIRMVLVGYDGVPGQTTTIRRVKV
jgi:bacillolysin